MTRLALRNQLRDLKDWKLAADLSDRDREVLADVGLGVISPEASRLILEQLVAGRVRGGKVYESVRHIARHGSEKTVETMLLYCRNSRPEALEHQANLCKSIELGSTARGVKLDAETVRWGSALVDRLLDSGQAPLIQQGIELAGTLKSASTQERLVRMLEKREGNEAQLIAALNALARIDPGKSTPLFGKLLTDSAQPAKIRDTSANLLGTFNTAESQEQLVKAMQSVPAGVQSVIAAALAGTPNGSEKLLEAIGSGKASAMLLRERGVEFRLRIHKLPNLDSRLARLTEGLPNVDQRLQDLIKRRRDAFPGAKVDLAEGAKVFEKRCAICHQLGGKGTKIGPQLDGIGNRGLERLLEDTLDPNRNVDQAFRTTILNLKSGQVVSGLLLREEGAVLVIADANGKEVRVPKDMVEERVTSTVSPMPANVAEQVQETEFYHLLAYLMSQKGGAR